MQVVNKKLLTETQFRLLLSAQMRVAQLQQAQAMEQTRLDEILLLIGDATGLNLSGTRVELNQATRELAVTVELPDPPAAPVASLVTTEAPPSE